MKYSLRTATVIVATLGLGAAAAAFAQQAPMGGGQHTATGMQRGGMMSGMQQGAMGQGAAGLALITPEERKAFQEKMQNATAEERQKLAEANREEMRKRAEEKGITLPQLEGPGHMH